MDRKTALAIADRVLCGVTTYRLREGPSLKDGIADELMKAAAGAKEQAILDIRDSANYERNNFPPQYRAGMLNAAALIEFRMKHSDKPTVPTDAEWQAAEREAMAENAGP